MFESKHMLKSKLAGAKCGKMANASRVPQRALCFRSCVEELLQKAWRFWLEDHLARGGELPPGNMPKDAPGADHFWQQRHREVVVSKILELEDQGPYR